MKATLQSSSAGSCRSNHTVTAEPGAAEAPLAPAVASFALQSAAEGGWRCSDDPACCSTSELSEAVEQPGVSAACPVWDEGAAGAAAAVATWLLASCAGEPAAALVVAADATGLSPLVPGYVTAAAPSARGGKAGGCCCCWASHAECSTRQAARCAGGGAPARTGCLPHRALLLRCSAGSASRIFCSGPPRPPSPNASSLTCASGWPAGAATPSAARCWCSKMCAASCRRLRYTASGHSLRCTSVVDARRPLGHEALP